MLRRSCAVALAALAVAAPAAPAHQGNPSYLTRIDAVTPAAHGVTVEVLNRDDRLLLRNTSGQDVVIKGYEGEPYARVAADGTLEVNTDSPAFYLNDDRFAQVKAPAAADGRGAPRWRELSRTGRFEWHDHRMHWMAERPPERLRGVTERREIFDWTVPVEIGGRAGAITGTLFWTPPAEGGPPTTAIVLLAAVIIAACVAVALVRRRRAPEGAGAAGEAW
jgi:hypothetical protein